MIIGIDNDRTDEVDNTHNHITFDEPVSMQTAMGTFYYLFDGLGSVTRLTDIGGNLVATYKYDAFGNILSETGDTTLNAINPYRFTSRVYDKESGLYYYRARYYDAKSGRFTQKDPLRSELTEGNNLYVYVENNPVNRVDPTGLATVKALQYKTCLWWYYWWGWKCGKWITVTYGYQIRLERSETTQLCQPGVDVVAFVTPLLIALASATAGAIAILVAAYIFSICYVHDAGYRVALNWYPVTPGILWVMSW